jgi:hypothetical protein
VRSRISEALKGQRAYKKEKPKRENRNVPQTPPLQEEEEDFVRFRITQVCWLEHELTAVHNRLEHALTELRELMGEMSPVGAHTRGGGPDKG